MNSARAATDYGHSPAWAIRPYHWHQGARLFGALAGAGRMTPVAAGSASGPETAELIVSVLLMGVVITSVIALALTILGLSKKQGAKTDETITLSN